MSWTATLALLVTLSLGGAWGWSATELIARQYGVTREAAGVAVVHGAAVATWKAAGGSTSWLDRDTIIRAGVGWGALEQTWPIPAGVGAVVFASAAGWWTWRGRWRRTTLSGTRWAGWGALLGAGLIWTRVQSTYYITLGWRLRGAVRIAVPQRATQLVHVAVLGGTRTGKSVSIIIPAVLDWRGALIVVEMKRELFVHTAGHRATRGRVWVHDPLDSRSHRFNLADGVGSVERAQQLAWEIIEKRPTGIDARFWDEAAGLLLTASILHAQAEAEQTMGAVWRALSGTPREVRERLAASRVREARELAAQAGISEERMGAGILQTVRAAIWLWSSPLVDHQTARSDFSVADLARDEAWTLYIRVRQADVAALRSWYRATLVRLLTGLIDAADRRPRKVPVLVLLDEMAALGKLNELPTWLETCAGRGIAFVLSVQSMAQLDAWGPDLRKRVLDNCAVRLAYRANDLATGEWMSKMVGEWVVRTQSRSRGWGGGSVGPGSVQHSFGERTAPLLTIAEAQELPLGVAVARVLDLPPLRLRTLPWWRQLEWRDAGRLKPPRLPHAAVPGLGGLRIDAGPPTGGAPPAEAGRGMELYLE